MKKIIAWILLLIVLAGGVYWINKLSYKASPLVQDTISKADWKTYENTQYGFSFRYPQNYTLYRENSNGFLAMFRDQSKVFPNPDVHNLIMVGAFPANKEVSFDNYIKKYPKVNGNTNRPFVFTPRVLGENTFYYTLTERFEGTLSFMYCILNNDTVLCFHSESNGVAWSDENLDVEADSTHAALRSVLSTIKFTSTINKPSITILSPNGGENWKKNSNQIISWNTSKDISNLPNLDIKLIAVNTRNPATTAYIVRDKSITDGKYLWNVGDTYTTLFNPVDGSGTVEFPSNGKFIIQVCEAGTTNCDTSDKYFTLLSESNSGIPIKACPTTKIINKMPSSDDGKTLENSYYIYNQERREINEFDLNWVKANCKVEDQVVY